MNRELYMAALRLLAQITQGDSYSAADLSIVRRHVLPREADLPLEVLCYEIINRELGESKASRRPIPPQSQQ
jgi:hypothetical protein